MTAPRVLVYSNQDEPLFELDPSHLHEMRAVEAINGEHSLTVTTTQRLEKMQRLLTVDETGKAREYVVTGVDEEHQGGRRPIGTYYAVWSLQHDLSGVYTTCFPGYDAEGGVSASTALSMLLESTARWSVGTVTQTTYGMASFYYLSGWKALSELVNAWGGEVDAAITVNGNGVASRSVNLLAHQGSTDAVRRFDYGADLTGIRRKVSDDRVTPRILPLGKSQGANGVRLDISSVNDDVMWLQDDDVATMYRVPDGSGGWEYPIQVIVNEECEWPEQLMEWAEEVKEQYTRPKVTYEASVAQLVAAGMDAHGLALGDASQVVDRTFGDEGLRISGRVVKLDIDELEPSNTVVTLGYLSDGLSGVLGGISADLESVKGSLGYMSTADYLNALLDRLNGEINADGGYAYIVPGHGIVCYDAEVSNPLVGTEASKVVQVKGGSIRIADTKNAQFAGINDWNWRTVFVSGHIASDLVTAANITTGYIKNAAETFVIDLDNGIYRMPAGATVGGQGVMTSWDIEYCHNQSRTQAPASDNPGWSTDMPAWQEGYYIWQRTVTYIGGVAQEPTDPVCISGRDGQTGTNAAALYLYKRSATTPSTLPGQLTYTFETAALSPTANLNGWSRAVPSGTDPCWVIMATALSNGVDDVIDASEWSDPLQMSSDAVDGLNQATVYLYQRRKSWVAHGSELRAPSAAAMLVSGTTATIPGTVSGTTLTIASTAPAKPSADSSYTFVTGALSPLPTGWYQSIPQGKDALWVTTAAAISSEASASIAGGANGDWAAPALMAESEPGIDKSEEQYYLSTSASSCTGGSWSTAQPKWESGKHVWTRLKLTWTDGIVTYTDPILAKAVNSANETAAAAVAELQAFFEGDYADDLEEIRGQVDLKAQTWYQSTDPSSGWSSSEKANHVGDLWYNTASGDDKNTTWRYSVSGSTCSWQKQDAPKAVFDKIDGKMQVFVSEPTPPYDIGDLWVEGSNGDIKRCATKRSSGNYNSSDWVLASKYTDDSAVVALDDALDQEGVLTRLLGNGQGIVVDPNTGNLLISATLLKSGALLVKDASNNTIFSADIDSKSVYLAGFTAKDGALYNGLTALGDNSNAGVYLGTGGIAAATSRLKAVLKDGMLIGYHDGLEVSRLVAVAFSSTTKSSSGATSSTSRTGARLRGGNIDLRASVLSVLRSNSDSGDSVEAVDFEDSVSVLSNWSNVGNILSFDLPTLHLKHIMGMLVEGWKISDSLTQGFSLPMVAFGKVKVGDTTIEADSAIDMLTLVAGSNVTLTPDATNDKVTIAATDTTYSAASTNTSGLMSAADKTKLNGITSGAAAVKYNGTAKSAVNFNVSGSTLNITFTS